MNATYVSNIHLKILRGFLLDEEVSLFGLVIKIVVCLTLGFSILVFEHAHYGD